MWKITPHWWEWRLWFLRVISLMIIAWASAWLILHFLPAQTKECSKSYELQKIITMLSWDALPSNQEK